MSNPCTFLYAICCGRREVNFNFKCLLCCTIFTSLTENGSSNWNLWVEYTHSAHEYTLHTSACQASARAREKKSYKYNFTLKRHLSLSESATCRTAKDEWMNSMRWENLLCVSDAMHCAANYRKSDRSSCWVHHLTSSSCELHLDLW